MSTMVSGMTALQLILRLFGTSSLFALVFVAAPRGWMQEIHVALGMGEMPDAPVVWYLARSASAFYAILGGLFWVLSFDPAGHRTVLRYLGWAIVLFGLSLYLIDYLEGLPLFWWTFEGSVVTTFGAAILVLTPRKEKGR